MKITGLETTIVAVPFKKPHPESFKVSTGPLIATIIQVHSDEGITGLGEAYGGELTKFIIERAEPLIVDEDPFDVQRIQKRLYAEYDLFHVHPHKASWALDAITMAIWDLMGKALGKPLYKLWGGAFRKRIPFWGWVHRAPLDRMADEAKDLVKEGYKTLYIKVGIDPKQDVEAVRVMRETVGDEVEIRVDANQAWSPGTAVRIIKRMEAYDLEMVEQPVSMYDLDGMAEVRRRVSTPILSHESSWTLPDVMNVIRRNAADVIQLDPRWGGGFIGVRKSAAVAEAAGLPVVMHSYSELGVATAAFMQVIASCPNFIYANQTMYLNLVGDVIKGGRLRFEDGCLALPGGPGIGVELDYKEVERYSELYLEEFKDRKPKKVMDDPRAHIGLKPRPDWVPFFPTF